MTDESPPDPAAQRTALKLSVLFGAMYFVQGIGEPTEGLVGQPVKSFLADRGLGAGDVAAFSAMLAMPWMVKPLYGLLTDFVPLFGSRRRSYLLLGTGAAAAGLLGLFAFFTPDVSRSALLIALLVPSVGMAVTDVTVDALMVEKGQKYGMTGRFQSIQWAAIYSAPIVGGPIAGYLAAYDWQRFGFLITGLATAASFTLVFAVLRDVPEEKRSGGWRKAVGTLHRAATTPGLAIVAGFLFLWNFNPFANDVLYMHLTRGIGLPESFYGWTISALSASAVVASVAYGFYCRRVPFGILLHASVALGVVSTVGYAFVVGQRSAIAVTMLVGFAYMTAVLIQFDLMARVCPPAVAGTAFALLMSVTNISLSSAIALGGTLYQRWKPAVGTHGAFQLVVAVGAACSLACWLFVPSLNRIASRDESVRDSGRAS